MRYASIRTMDVSDGEGVGCSLFVQGCHFHCKNCFNQSTWDFNGGKEWTEDIENKFIELVKRPYITRVSILGGEPLADENVDEIFFLIQKIKKIRPDINIWLYTGYLWENLVEMKNLIITKKERDKSSFYCTINSLIRIWLLPSIDVLVDGQYVDELKDMNLPFRGSSNQRLIDVKKTIDYWYKGENKIIEYEIKN